MFFYQAKVSTLVLKREKGSEHVIAWISKELFKTEFCLLRNVLVRNVKRFGCKIGIQFNNNPLIIGKNNYADKIENAYIFYDLDSWPSNLLNNFVVKIAYWVQLI